MTGQDKTPRDTIVSRIVSRRPRRRRGQGSIFRDNVRGCWLVSIHTTDGVKRARAMDYPEAKRKLADLKRAHRAILTSAYRPWRRIDGDPPRSRGVRPRQRFRILARDGFACHYCGRKPPVVELDIDHVVPVADGGSNDDENLVAACSDCNHGKADIGLPPSADARSW